MNHLFAIARRHRVTAALVLALLVVLPGLVALLNVAGRRWYPAGDMAQAELHMRGFFSHPPLVGAAGRIVSDSGVQGSHPGPALWVAMLPVYTLFGRSSLGLMTAVWSVHLAAAWLTLALAARRSLLLAGALAAVLALVVRASGPPFALEPWNPWLAVLPFAGLLIAAWLAIDEHQGWAVLAVALGSYCIQCHIGYIPVVGACLATMAAVLVARAVRARDRSIWKTSALAVLVTFLMWLPPLLDQLRREPGNLTILFQHFVSPGEAYLSLRTVADVLMTQLSALGPWVTGPSLLSRNRPAVIVTCALWVAAVVIARRSADRSALRLHLLLAATLAGGIFAITRVFGGYMEYTIRWFWIVTATIVAASVWALVRGLEPRWHRISLALLTVVGVTATGVGVVQFQQRAVIPGEPESRLLEAIVDDTAAALDAEGRYLVRYFDPVGLAATAYGLLLELERRGFDVGADLASAAAALPHRVMPEPTATSIVYLVLGAAIEDFRDAGYPEIAAADLRTDAQRARFDELDVALRAALVELGRPDLADTLDKQFGSAKLLFMTPPLPGDVLELVIEYVELRLPASVFLVPVGSRPPLS